VNLIVVSVIAGMMGNGLLTSKELYLHRSLIVGCFCNIYINPLPCPLDLMTQLLGF